MFSQKIFISDFRTALEEELARTNMSIRELAKRAGVPAATIYKITSGERDPRFSTVRAIVNALEVRDQHFVAVIAAKFLLDEIGSQKFTRGEISFTVRGYTANTVDDCIIAAVRAEKEGALGIICAPVLASVIERIVDIPVVIMKPKIETFIEAFNAVAQKIPVR